jgi:hypothetical protein
MQNSVVKEIQEKSILIKSYILDVQKISIMTGQWVFPIRIAAAVGSISEAARLWTVTRGLRDEEARNTVFWQELQASKANRGLPSGTKKFVEDDEDQDDEGPGDSDVAVAAVIADVANKRKGRVA